MAKETAYDKLKEVNAELGETAEFYEKVRHIAELPEYAAQLAHEEDDKTAEAYLLDPKTPDSVKARFVQGKLKLQDLKLEELVETKFPEILRGASKSDLERALFSYSPEKTSGSNSQTAEYHRRVLKANRNLAVYANRNKQQVSQTDVDNALGDMKKAVAEHYIKKYAPEKGDSKQEAEAKKIKVSLFVGLYAARDEALVGKYSELSAEDAEELSKRLDSKDALVNYMLATLPKDLKKRKEFAKRLAEMSED